MLCCYWVKHLFLIWFLFWGWQCSLFFVCVFLSFTIFIHSILQSCLMLLLILSICSLIVALLTIKTTLTPQYLPSCLYCLRHLLLMFSTPDCWWWRRKKNKEEWRNEKKNEKNWMKEDFPASFFYSSFLLFLFLFLFLSSTLCVSIPAQAGFYNLAIIEWHFSINSSVQVVGVAPLPEKYN